MYIVTGATGNTGKLVAQGLLDAGKSVKVISRSAEKVKTLTEKGAESFIGNMENTDFLNRSFEGATAVYALIPLHMTAPDVREYQNKIAEAIANAIKVNGVKYVVSLSSVGAHLKENGGVVQGLHDMEQKLNSIEGLNVLHLRPTYFMENLFAQIDTIKRMGVIGSTVKADISFPMVATKDIAKVAVEKLLALDFQGPDNITYVLGDRDYNYNEVAGIIGRSIDQPNLKYVEFPVEQAKIAMVQNWGVSESLADAMIEFGESLNKGKVMEEVRRNEQSTTSTSLEEFSHIFKSVYQNS